MHITQKDIRQAQKVYLWLLLAPVIVIPCSSLVVPTYSDSNAPFVFSQALIRAAFASIFYLPLFVWAFSPNLFLKAHARQGLIILVLQGLLFSINSGVDYALYCLINVFQACIWFAGGFGGLLQVGKGRAWIGGISGTIEQPTPTPQPVKLPVKKEAVLDEGTLETRIAYHLKTFRTGSQAEREAAAEALEALGQVESF